MLGELKTTPNEWDARFMRMAHEAATWSKDPQAKVGSLVVSPDRRQMTPGYNGFPVGVHDTNDRLRSGDKNLLTVHAELNAILNARDDLTGWTLYATRQPCVECAKAIIQARIARVVSPVIHQNSDWLKSCVAGADMMREAGIKLSYILENKDG